jgi:iron(III) transport system ATP-binding protein
VDLASVADNYPYQLSGGQQQRIALIRALAPKPALLLLDEPFSSLDRDLREQLAIEVRELLQQEAVTAILVSHDQSEAFAMADKIGVMQDGHLRQWDTAYNLYHSPTEHFVADFIGEGVFLAGTVINEAGDVKTQLGILPSQAVIHKGCAVKVLVRPDDISFDPDSPIQAQIIEKQFRGAFYLYRLKLPEGAEVLILHKSHFDLALHEMIGIRLSERKWVTWQN